MPAFWQLSTNNVLSGTRINALQPDGLRAAGDVSQYSQTLMNDHLSRPSTTLLVWTAELNNPNFRPDEPSVSTSGGCVMHDAQAFRMIGHIKSYGSADIRGV